MARAAMREVELADAEPTPPAPRRRLRPRVRWVVAGALAVATLVAGQAVIDAHARAADARLARVAGAVAPLRSAPHVAWTAVGADARVLVQGVAADGVSVGLQPRPDGSRDVVGIDLDDGRARWSAVVDGPDDLRAGTPSPATDAACDLVAGAGPARVACVTTNRVATSAYGLFTVRRSATRGHLVVLDVATGRRLVDRAAPPSLAVAALPDVLVVATTGDDGRTHVVGQDLATGAQRWADVLPRSTVSTGGVPPTLVALGAREVGVVDGPRSVTVVGAGGAVARTLAGPSVGWGVSADGSLWLVSGEHLGSGDGLVTSRLVRPDGTGLEVAGRIAAGGSLAGLVVTTGAQVRAFDPGGAPRWTSDVRGVAAGTAAGALVLRGAVVLTTDDGVVALATDDGRTLWRASAGGGVTGLFSDGLDALAVEDGPDGASLVAYRPSDGSVRWHVPLPSGDVRALGRALVVVSDGSVARLAS